MRKKVRLQVTPLIEASSADRTFVRRLLHVQDPVHRQGPALAESFAAVVALERLLLAVYVPASVEVTFPSSPACEFKPTANHPDSPSTRVR